VGDTVRSLTVARRAEIAGDIERLADRALRTLAVGFRQVPHEDEVGDAPGLVT
jgi:hypothetical protein